MRNANVNVGNKKRVVIPEGRNRGSSTHLSLRNETTNSVRGRFPSPSRTGKLGNDALFLRQVSSDLQTFNAPLYPGLQISGMTSGASGGFTPALVIPVLAVRARAGYSAGYKSGFTLIELLVVVLIIGILAAVALPQYNLAVAKARVNRLLPLMKSIAEAQNVYRMANGQYATEFAALDIDMPAGQQSNSEPSHFRYEEFDCYLHLTSYSMYCQDKRLPVQIEHYYSGAQFCWAKESSLQAGKKLCKYICKLSSEIGANSRGCRISTPL